MGTQHPEFSSTTSTSPPFTLDPHAPPFSTAPPTGQVSSFDPTAAPPSAIESLARGRRSQRSFISRAHRREGRDSAIGSPSQQANVPRRRSSEGDSGIPHDPFYAQDGELLADEAAQPYVEDNSAMARHSASLNAAASRDHDQTPQTQRLASIHRAFAHDDPDDSSLELDGQLMRLMSQGNGPRSSLEHDAIIDSSRHRSMRILFNNAMKRPRDKIENIDSNNITQILNSKGAVAAMVYSNCIPNPKANDIWPECRSPTKLPSHYSLLDRNMRNTTESRSKPRPLEDGRHPAGITQPLHKTGACLPDAHVGRPQWRLPVELVELIAEYLNRDDIKSLRLVSRELNYYVSQVIFETVVVPFNTEIYGMLGQEPKIDFKGKKRVKIERPGYLWKNANGDEMYNGHGLDVFRGFGKHIIKYGMSFEVSEASLSMPPTKLLTEKKTSFWGNYDWPFDEYRRFDAMAGLETAADETPRMKIAFSELSKVKELALSIDSGLGWLNGPDRSIRARILQKPPQVFGTSKDIPDRRAQAQQELWRQIEACHRIANNDVRFATLYRMDGQRSLAELNVANMLAEQQPNMPYLDLQLLHEATPHDAADIQIPISFDDPEVLNHFVLAPCCSGNGILFSSPVLPPDAGQLMSPIIPANLTKAQKEWLLETEWAQRAFLSSYMLSVIDNPLTFTPVHTLNISRLSDRYLPMLSRADFWSALPNLTNVTLIVIPGWRTVYKDEAGFVDAPRIRPFQGMDHFFKLLQNHIAHRSNIRSLTFGWESGGEHAEGVHARNKLIMPAPLRSSMRFANNLIPAPDALLDDNVNRLMASLLHFPHVERLTLKNCWITPPALLQFVKIHDSLKLRHLVLDSVSLTAMPRLAGNANPQPAGGALWNPLNNGGAQAVVQAQAQQPVLPFNLQTIQMQLSQLLPLQANNGIQQQSQITALQNMIQQQIQQLQAQNPQQAQAQAQAQGQGNVQTQQSQLTLNTITNIATQLQYVQHHIAAFHQLPLPAGVSSYAYLQSALKAQPREGSWLNIIDIISPGTNLFDFGSEYSQADSERCTSLQSIEFISCGYAKLMNPNLDQTTIESADGLAAAFRNPIFTKRYLALAPAMLSSKWTNLGEIVQEVDLVELGALDAGWNLQTGWTDKEKARSVEFDGLLPGGSGRFSGVIRQSDRVVD